MPLARVCPTCSRIVQPGDPHACDQERARARNAQPHRRAHRTRWHAKLRAYVFTRDGHRCVDCGTTHDLTLDYLVPLQDGGAMTSSNAETRCRSCNSHHGRRGFFSAAPLVPAPNSARVSGRNDGDLPGVG